MVDGRARICASIDGKCWPSAAGWAAPASVDQSGSPLTCLAVAGRRLELRPETSGIVLLRVVQTAVGL